MKHSGISASCKITVKNKLVTKITLNKTKVTIKKGKTFQLKVKAIKPTDAFNQKATWKSSNKEIATVDKNGKVKAVRKQHVGFIFQNFNLIPELTALENVDITADKAEDPGIARRMLELVGLQDKLNAYPAQMSGGQQQRVSIARALAKCSELMLCDEPTGALDSETGQQILILLEELVRIHGKTVVIVTHTREVGRMADRIIELRNGKIIREETNEQIVSAREIAW